MDIPIPSLKLTQKHPKMDGWNTIVSFWDDLFSGALAVSFKECNGFVVFLFWLLLFMHGRDPSLCMTAPVDRPFSYGMEKTCCSYGVVWVVAVVVVVVW